jgi:REP element-mobilizing transposase RayT
VAREARSKLDLQCGAAPKVHHVTSRGVASLPLFRSDVDRLKFLSLLAFYAGRHGIVLHVFCLMSNHVHLLLEDPRGNLSKFMKGLKQSYAQYFNDVRGKRGHGHVFKGRFWSAQVEDVNAYDLVASYILLNPLRCSPKLAERAERYPWSSAALHCSKCAPADVFRALVERAGGVEAVLAEWPRPSRVEYGQRWREHLAALLRGDWIAPEAARCGRTPDQMRQVVCEREGMPRPEPEEARACGEARGDMAPRRSGRRRQGRTTIARLVEQIPRVTKRFTGERFSRVCERIREGCAEVLPSAFERAGQVGAYLLWRYTDGTRAEIARTIKSPPDATARAIEEVRWLRKESRAWAALLWRVEWSLHFRLDSAPWRA